MGSVILVLLTFHCKQLTHKTRDLSVTVWDPGGQFQVLSINICPLHKYAYVLYIHLSSTYSKFVYVCMSSQRCVQFAPVVQCNSGVYCRSSAIIRHYMCLC